MPTLSYCHVYGGEPRSAFFKEMWVFNADKEILESYAQSTKFKLKDEKIQSDRRLALTVQRTFLRLVEHVSDQASS